MSLNSDTDKIFLLSAVNFLRMKKIQALLLLIFIFQSTANAQTERSILPSDIYHMQDVSDPQISPDGNWVAYVLSSVDSVKDKRNKDIWMISWDGKQNVQLTNSPEDEASPRWSPDGKYLSFLSSRSDGNKKDDNDNNAQLWLLNRLGGEGKKITSVKGEIEDYACYLFFGSAIKFAINLYAPGTPAGNSRKNTNPVYTKFPLPYFAMIRLPLLSDSFASCIPNNAS